MISLWLQYLSTQVRRRSLYDYLIGKSRAYVHVAKIHRQRNRARLIAKMTARAMASLAAPRALADEAVKSFVTEGFLLLPLNLASSAEEQGTERLRECCLAPALVGALRSLLGNDYAIDPQADVLSGIGSAAAAGFHREGHQQACHRPRRLSVLLSPAAPFALDVIPRSHLFHSDHDANVLNDLASASPAFRFAATVPAGTAVLLHPHTLRRLGKQFALGQEPKAVALPVCHRLRFWRVSEPTEPTWSIDHWGEMQDSYRTSPFAKALPPRDAWLQCAWESIYLWMRGEGAAPTAPPTSKLLATSSAIRGGRVARTDQQQLAEAVASPQHVHSLRVGYAYVLGASGQAGDDDAIETLAKLLMLPPQPARTEDAQGSTAHASAEDKSVVRRLALLGLAAVGDDAVPLLSSMLEELFEDVQRDIIHSVQDEQEEQEQEREQEGVDRLEDKVALVCDLIVALGEAAETPEPELIEQLVQIVECAWGDAEYSSSVRSQQQKQQLELARAGVECLGLLAERVVSQHDIECLLLVGAALIQLISRIDHNNHIVSAADRQEEQQQMQQKEALLLDAARGVMRLCSDGTLRAPDILGGHRAAIVTSFSEWSVSDVAACYCTEAVLRLREQASEEEGGATVAAARGTFDSEILEMREEITQLLLDACDDSAFWRAAVDAKEMEEEEEDGHGELVCKFGTARGPAAEAAAATAVAAVRSNSARL
jgi:hypothetical protein